MGGGQGRRLRHGQEDTVSSRVEVWEKLGLLQRPELLDLVPWAPRKHVALLLPFSLGLSSMLCQDPRGLLRLFRRGWYDDVVMAVVVVAIIG